MNDTGDARIVDRGYRAYDGPRGGPADAVRTVAKHSVQRTLGIKRTIWQKILPVVVIALAFLPAVALVGVSALVGDSIDAGDLISYADYFGIIGFAILLFSAFVAPEILCTDRRSGLLGMYLAAPLTRGSYLLAKAIAVLLVLAIVTVGPQLLMLIAFTFQSAGPESVGEFFELLLQIVAGGAVVSLLYTAVSLAVSSLTDRKAFASAGFVVAVLVTSFVAGAITELADGSDYWGLLNFTGIPFELVYRIFDEPSDEPRAALAQLDTSVLTLGFFAWLSAAIATIHLTYKRLVVTR